MKAAMHMMTSFCLNLCKLDVVFLHFHLSMYVTISDQLSAVNHPAAERQELYLISSVLADSAARIQQGISSSGSHIPGEHLSELN